jgi:type I site-specific restriction endonuclease
LAKKISSAKKLPTVVKKILKVLSQFRNDYYPRIAVTVDMIATGTDIRPLEVLVFMRDVKSRSYYEQMKGRGTRTCSFRRITTERNTFCKI